MNLWKRVRERRRRKKVAKTLEICTAHDPDQEHIVEDREPQHLFDHDGRWVGTFPS